MDFWGFEGRYQHELPGDRFAIRFLDPLPGGCYK